MAANNQLDVYKIILKKKGVPNGVKVDDLSMLAMTFLFY